MPRHPRPAARRTLTLAALAPLLATLVACSNSSPPSAEYCELLTSQGAAMDNLTLAPDSISTEQIEAMRRIQDAAPRALRADWKVFTEYLEALASGDEAALDKNPDRVLAAANAIDESAGQCATAYPSGPTTTP